LDQKIKNYQDFFYDLIREDDLTNKATIQDLIQNLIKQRELLDPKEEIQAFLVRCEEYLELLNQVLRYGSREGIENRLRQLEDEEKKLKEAREIKQRKKTPLLAKCSIYPPEGGTNLIVQLPEDLAQRFRYEEIVRGKIGVPYYEEKEKEIKEDKNLLLDLKQRFEQSQDHLKRLKDNLRTQISKTSEDLRHKKMVLQEQRTILEADKERFLKNREETEKISKIVKKVKKAKEWFARLWEALDEGEALKRIKKETIAYINRIYEEIYNWEINARLEEDDKIVITDTHGNIRSHPSGSEIHVMGLAWRWLIARGFDLPLVLDELDALLDEKNFERTKELIKERLDRQTIILTLKEGLKSLPGKIYKVTRQGEISFLSPFIF
jgi:DNA repair exonuclease SbcCD ATPase subunit